MQKVQKIVFLKYIIASLLSLSYANAQPSECGVKNCALGFFTPDVIKLKIILKPEVTLKNKTWSVYVDAGCSFAGVLTAGNNIFEKNIGDDEYFELKYCLDNTLVNVEKFVFHENTTLRCGVGENLFCQK